MKKKIFWVIVCLLIVLGLFYKYVIKKDEKIIKNNTQEQQDVEQKILTFTIDGRSPTGVKQWQLKGESAEVIEDQIHLHDLDVIAYGEEAQINLKSDSGVYCREKGELDLMGNVEVISDEGFTLLTDKAHWKQNTKEVSTDSVVHVKGEGITAVGVGAQADPDKRIAILKKKVKVFVEPGTQIICDGSLNIMYYENKAVFYDNVKVKDKDGNLFADQLTVEINPETKKLLQVTAEGNVKVKKGNSYTLSDKAIYTDSTKSAKLLGKPRIIIDPEEIDKLEDFENN